jgi:ureidoacrylate peracid hydrolase
VSDLTYDATRTALLVVDPYDDFISEGGKLYELSRETITSQDCVTHMREVLAAARAAGVLVCYAPHHRWRPADYETWHYTAPTQESGAKNQVFAADTWGGTFHPDFQPAPGELVAQEHWLSSGFANTDLDLILKRHGIERVIVIGLRANTCIDSTVRSAAELGYDVTLVTDAIAAFRQAEIDATVQLNAPSYARTRTPTAELVRALGPGTEPS